MNHLARCSRSVFGSTSRRIIYSQRNPGQSISRLLSVQSGETSGTSSSKETPENGPQDQATTEAASSTERSGDAQQSQLEQLAKQLEERDAQLAELNDRSLRAFAEMENVRMIARRDVDNARKYAIGPFAKSMLSVADNLGLALGSVDEDLIEKDDSDPLLKGLFVGVRATESELLKVFSQYGISRFGEVGDKFDPNKYQAMFEAPSEEHEPGTVINVQKLGYAMGDRILRPAEVGVSRVP